MIRILAYAILATLLSSPVFAQDLSSRKEAVELYMSPHDLKLLGESQALSSALAQAISAQTPTSSPSKLKESLRLQLSMQEAIISAAEAVVKAETYMEAVLAMDRQKIADRMASDLRFQQFQLREGYQFDQSPEVLAYRERNRDSVIQMRVHLGKTLDTKAVNAVLRHDAALAIFYDRTLDVVDRERAFNYLSQSIGPLKPLY